MKKLIIRIEINTEIAQKILKKYQFFVYNAVLKALIGLIYRRLKNYDSAIEGNIYYFTEKGEDDYIEMEKRKFDAFMFSDYKDLHKDKYKEFNRLANDRLIHKVISQAHKFKDLIKEKAVKIALDDGNVMGFFAKTGLFISSEIIIL